MRGLILLAGFCFAIAAYITSNPTLLIVALLCVIYDLTEEIF